MTNASRALTVALLVGLVSRAHAEDNEPSAVNVEEATALFNQARKLMDEGETAKACAKFQASENLDPAEGTRMNLAQCFDKLGKTASAWKLYTEIAKVTKKENRRATASKRSKDLESELVRLTIEVPESSEIDGLEITRNDVVVDKDQWNQAVPVDPDDYTITAKAKGHEEWSKRVKIKAKDKVVEIPKLVKVKAQAKDEPELPNRHRKLAIALAGGGGGAIVIGSVFALHGRSQQNKSDELCNPTYPTCGAEGVTANRQARRDAMVANITWVVGGATLAGAVVAYVMGRKQPEPAISIAPVIDAEHMGFAFGGRF